MPTAAPDDPRPPTTWSVPSTPWPLSSTWIRPSCGSRNYVKPEDFPFETKVGMVMDSGQYAATLDRLLEMADVDSLREEQAKAREEGRYLGIGLTTYVENCGLAPSAMFEGGFSWAGYGLPSAFNESAAVRANPDGSVTVVTGTGPTGQGHETTWAQIASDTLGVPFDRVKVRHGDTHDSPMGIGTFGSRSAAVGGPAVARAAGRVQEKAARIAAHMLEAAAEDIRFEDGKAFVAGSPEQSVDWDDLVATAYQQYQLPEGVEAGLEDVAFFDPTNATWPYGAHMAVVEVDPETGNVELLRYLAVDDCGTVINPMIVAGQIHGGIAQGIGQALFEEAVYDENGSLLTPSLADYQIPTAADIPSFEMDSTVTPTDANPLGVKGDRRGGDHRVGSDHRGRRARRPQAAGGADHRHAATTKAGLAGDTGCRSREVRADVPEELRVCRPGDHRGGAHHPRRQPGGEGAVRWDVAAPTDEAASPLTRIGRGHRADPGARPDRGQGRTHLDWGTGTPQRRLRRAI